MKRRKVVLATGSLTSTAIAGCLGGNSSGPENDNRGQGSRFAIRVESFDQEVKQGEEVMVSFTVENSGEQRDTQTIQFKVNGSVVDSITGVQLQTGESLNDRFTYTTGSGDPPEIDITIETNQETTQRTIIVNPRPPVEALEMGIADVRGISVGVTSATIPIFFEIKNTHSEREVPSPTIQYTGYINGEEAVSNRKLIASLGPGEAVTKEFGLTAQYTELGRAVVTAIEEKSFTVRITGTIESDDATVSFDDSYEY